MVVLQKTYLLSWLICLLALAIWSTFRKPARFMAPIGFLAFAVWVCSLFMMPQGWETKLLWLFRDAMIVSVALALSNTLKANKIIGIAYLLGLSILGKWAWEHQNLFFPEPLKLAVLDQQAEFLLMPQNGTKEIDSDWLASELGVEIDLSKCFEMPSSETSLIDDTYCLDILTDNPRALKQTIRRLNTLSDYLYWEMNEVVGIEDPMDSGMQKLKKNLPSVFNDPDIQQQWGLEAIEAENMSKRIKDLKPKKKSWLVILDTGVESGHEDLQDNYKSFGKKNEVDRTGHGTHVAGIAAATTNNGIGVASLATRNDLLQYSVINVLPNNGFGNQKTIVDGMIKAADAGADVISMSLGGFSNPKRKKVYDEAVAYCTKKGAIVVVAAGNSSRSANDFSPANAEGVIAVSAIDENGDRASFSNTTDGLKMAIAAPGTNIHSTYIKNSYKALNGTSMATPFVSATIAVLKAFEPSLTAEEAFVLLHGDRMHTKKDKLNSADAIDRLINSKTKSQVQ